MSDERLARLLGGPDTAWLVDRARRRLELGRPLTGSVTLPAASPEQRRAVERLLGRRAGTGSSLSISLDEVDRVLRRSGAAPGGLVEAVVVLRGPVRDIGQEEAERGAAWRAAYAELDTLVAERPELSGWRSWLDTTGLVRRVAPDPARATVLLSRLAVLLRRLPSSGVPLGRLAAETCGDAHALDDGEPLSTLALPAARALAGATYAGDGTADARRRAWASVGVHLDELSPVALCLGLTGDDTTATGRMLAAARTAGEPCVLTLRQLRRHSAPLTEDLVRVCENPIVIAAAADELGPACPPLVCVNGHPSAAVWTLLTLLASSGAHFAYHGDFDWGGVTIAAAVHERYGFTPWRYDTTAYEELTGGDTMARSLSPLTGRPRPTPWDAGLSRAMERRGARAEEELALGDLLSDLSSRPDKS